MFRKAGFRAGAVVAALMVVLVAVAVAAGGLSPRLLSPNHKRVGPGRIRLAVDVPVKPTSHGVFIAVSRSRKLDEYGHLKVCGSTASGCDFVSPTHWKGRDYSYLAPFNFPGYWSVTPGKYYWQAHYYSNNPLGVYWSGIGSFVVK